MNAGMKAYQSMQKAARDVEQGKTGAKMRLKSATKRYVDHVEKTAKKEAEQKIKDAKKRATAISGVKPKKAKAKTAKPKKRTTTSKRRTAKSGVKVKRRR